MRRRGVAIAATSALLLLGLGVAAWSVHTAPPEHVWVRDTLRTNRTIGVPHVVASPDGIDLFLRDWDIVWTPSAQDGTAAGDWLVEATRRRRGIEARVAALLKLADRVETYSECGPRREEGPYTWTRYELR